MNTKTLNQQVNEIKNNTRMSANKKAEALVKLGVTPYEAMIIARASMPAPTPRATRFTYTFGVEIECVGCEFGAFKTAAENNGLRVFEQFFYNHRDMPMYKLTTDSSIAGDHAAECVTPALNGNRTGFESLKGCCKALSEIGASVNRSCGLHVHIGAASLNEEQYCNVFFNYMRMETAIDSFLAPSRRDLNAQWCASLTPHAFAIEHADRREQVRRALGSRYHRVNAEAWVAHKTIEFRQHQGTTNFTKISNWVKFLGKLVEWSRTNRLENVVTRIEDIPFLTQAEKNYFISRRGEFENQTR